MIRMLLNLLHNAIQYGNTDGYTWIELHQRGEKIIITIEDDGVGIPQSEQENIWRRFYQVEKHRENEKGSGLGLSIVRWIIERHGGEITLSSKPEKGSRFTISLNDKKAALV